MKTVKLSLTRIVGWIIAFVVCLTLLPNIFPIASAAEPLGNCSHNYVSNMQINASVMTAQSIPTFTYSAGKTEYEGVQFIDTSAGTLILTLNENVYRDGTMGYSLFVGDTRIKTTKIDEQVEKMPLALASAKLNMNTENTVSIRIGTFVDTRSSVTNYDEYVLHVSVLPGIGSLALTDSGTSESITLSPEFELGMCYFTDTFTALTSAEKVDLKLKFNSAKKVACYLDTNKTVECTNNSLQTITLSEYIDEDDTSGIAKIPIHLVYSVDGEESKENTFYLYIADPDKFSPVITTQPQNVTCDKGATPTLSVAATDPDGDDNLTYQWYKGKYRHVMEAISGATAATYVVPATDTMRAGTTYYRCDVTNATTQDKFGELTFTSNSETVAVDTQLTYVSTPKILHELGSFKVTEDNSFAANYRTTYSAGEKFDLMYIAVEPPEEGVTLSYEYYYGTEPTFASAELLKTEASEAKSGSINGQSYVTHCARPTSGFDAGVYYVWCVVTATAEDGRTAQRTSGPVRLEYQSVSLDFENGAGTKDDPYMIKSEADFVKIRDYVYNGQWCSGIYFQMANDIELSSSWTPIGEKNESLKVNERTIQAFGGILDGAGHKLTVATGGKPLFNYVSDATIKNLDIYGEKINGDGLIDLRFADYGPDGDYWTGVPDCVTLDGVRLLEGSSTLESGFMHGSGSGANTITIRNCVVEDNVVIGYNKDQYGIGSFVGAAFNGQIENSSSSATVYGIGAVGGLAGKKGQAVGLCDARNSCFLGEIEATGEWIGGIIGCGYYSDSAPNTVPVSIVNCYVAANITGGDYVGGIFGGEEGLKAAINMCWITDNHYYGTITATGEHVGGLIGWYESINNIQEIANNYYYEVSGTAKNLIGGVGTYWFTDESEKEKIIANMGSAKTADQFKNGEVLGLLNSGSDYKNWVQGELYPILNTENVITSLQISGEYQTEYYIGDSLNFDGIEITAVYSDGHTETVPLEKVTIDGFDNSTRGQQTVIIKYQGAEASIPVTVLLKNDITITVFFTMLGDTAHGAPAGEADTHTLASDNLDTWIDRTAYTVDINATVMDVIQAAFADQDITYTTNASGTYISSVTYQDIALGELTNGDASNKDLADAYTKTGAKLATQTPKSGSIDGEWMMLGLARANHAISEAVKQTYLEAVAAYINENYANGKLHDNKSTENSRLILALTALGEDPATFVSGKNLLSGLADFDWVKSQGINGPIWALIALDSQEYAIPNSSYSTKTTRDLLIDYILSYQLNNGGWSTSGTTADADMTAMAVQALAPYYNTKSEVKTAVDKALSRLSKMQDATTGAFSDYDGTLNAESTAQVVVALTTMGIDPNTDSDFITNSGLSVMDGLMLFYNGDGEFKHIVNGRYNKMATEQSYYCVGYLSPN